MLFTKFDFFFVVVSQAWVVPQANMKYYMQFKTEQQEKIRPVI